MQIRKTKIVCTLGPAVDSEEKIKNLVNAGMNVARLNFSHGTHESHLETLGKVRRVRDQLGKPVAVMLDTKGPEIRLRNFKEGKVHLKKGQRFTLTTRELDGDSLIASITYKDLPKDVKAGGRILIDDGLVELDIERVAGTEIICRVANGGEISNHKGVNVPDCELSMPFISEQDRSDIIFAAQNDFDFIAASFTRSADDIREIRKILEEYNAPNIRIIAKIENMQGIRNIDGIIDEADGIMVARGDMGVEIPLEEVPILQKVIIRKVYEAGKVAITATQMLDSMMHNPRPTRAEATDVANAIYDGTSAIMLSGETAAGEYPIEAVQTMDRIAICTEQAINYAERYANLAAGTVDSITNAISHACCMTSNDLGASAIVTVTKSGYTARMISRYRPQVPIVACTMSQKVYQQLAMSWGVIPCLIDKMDSIDSLFDKAIDIAAIEGIVNPGDKVVLTAGVPLGVSGNTNIMKVAEV